MQPHPVSNHNRPHSHTPPHQYQQPVQVRQPPQVQQQQQQHSHLPKSQMNGESKMGAQRPQRNVYQNQVSFLIQKNHYFLIIENTEELSEPTSWIHHGPSTTIFYIPGNKEISIQND